MQSYWSISDAYEDVVPADGSNGEALSIEVVNETGTFAHLAKEWDELIDRSSATVFQTFEWQFSWWKHFGSRPEHHLFLVLFRAQQKLVAIAPFLVQTYSFLHFNIYRRLMLLGSGLEYMPSPLLSLVRQGPSDYLDLIVAQGHEESVSKSLVAFLCNRSQFWDDIELQNMRGKGILCTTVVPLLEPQGYSVAMKEEDTCPYITLPTSLEEYYASLRHSVRRNLRYVHRGYLENKEFQIDDIAAHANTEGGMQILEQLHQKRWNAIGYPGLFADPRFGPFMKEAIELLARKGRVWFKIIRQNGKAIAVNLILKLHDRLYTYISGFDRDATAGSSNSGAGSALILLAIEDAIKEGLTEVDMGRGTEPYKSQFTSVASKNWRITITPNPSRRGTVSTSLFRVRSLWIQTASRIECELFIFRILAKQKGRVHALQAYASHVWYRMTRTEGNSFTQNPQPPTTPEANAKNNPAGQQASSKRAPHKANGVPATDRMKSTGQQE